MPIYEYRCRACGVRFEQLVRAGATVACPGCAGQQLDKLLSSVAPPGKSAAIIAGARTQAARAGHLSNE
jgi:putative FmdB family regulatory protein